MEKVQSLIKIGGGVSVRESEFNLHPFLRVSGHDNLHTNIHGETVGTSCYLGHD